MTVAYILFCFGFALSTSVLWATIPYLGMAFTMLALAMLDIWYWVRTGIALVYGGTQRIDLLAEDVRTVLVLPGDIDFNFHMNNARFLRECDFARSQLLASNGLFRTVYRDHKSKFALAASTIRYRQSLLPFQIFRIVSKVVCWDDKAFYIESRFTSARDGMVNAIMYGRQAIIGCGTADVLRSLGVDTSSPTPSADLALWIQANALSSKMMRAESGLHSKMN
jgi:acyl-CoA thioesterase FadM